MISCLQFKDGQAELWDKFVLNDAINGTFLQTRNFLSYHPKERFEDDSFFIGDTIYDIYAAVPGSNMNIDGIRTFISHPGSTFGGLVFNKIRYTLRDVLTCLGILEEYLKEKGYQRAIFKLTPDLFSSRSSDLLQYLLKYRGFSEYTELSAYIDFSDYDPNVKMNFNNAKRRKLKKCEALGMNMIRIESDSEIRQFYGILEENLKKHNASPIHSIDELLNFKKSRLKDIVSFFGVYAEIGMIAGAMVFSFDNGKVFHLQNTAAIQSYNHESPMSFLFYSLISHALNAGYEKVSFGISTEDQGRVLNMSLAETKESYGCGFSLNRTFYKDI